MLQCSCHYRTYEKIWFYMDEWHVFWVVRQNLVQLHFGGLKLCTLGSFHVNKLLTLNVTHQTTLCVSSRLNKRVGRISLLRKHSQRRFVVIVALFASMFSLVFGPHHLCFCCSNFSKHPQLFISRIMAGMLISKPVNSRSSMCSHAGSQKEIKQEATCNKNVRWCYLWSETPQGVF